MMLFYRYDATFKKYPPYCEQALYNSAKVMDDGFHCGILHIRMSFHSPWNIAKSLKTFQVKSSSTILYCVYVHTCTCVCVCNTWHLPQS